MLATSDLLKEGTKHLSGVSEACLQNIDAVRQLANILRTSLGPNGTNYCYYVICVLCMNFSQFDQISKNEKLFVKIVIMTNCLHMN